MIFRFLLFRIFGYSRFCRFLLRLLYYKCRGLIGIEQIEKLCRGILYRKNTEFSQWAERFLDDSLWFKKPGLGKASCEDFAGKDAYMGAKISNQ
jgi:hypothetical protein